MILVCYLTNLEVGNMKVSLKITENIIIKGFMSNFRVLEMGTLWRT